MSDLETTNGTSPQPETTPDKSGQGGDEPKLTQSQVNEIVKERLTRAEETLTKKLLDELGVDSLDTAKATLKAKLDAEEAEKSELQKAQDALKAEQERVKALTEAQQKREAEIRLERLDSAILGALKDKEVEAINPKQVLTLMKAEGLEGLMDDEGKIDETKLTQKVNKHREDNPHLYKPKRLTPGSPSNSDGTSGTKQQDKIAAAQRQFQAVLNKGT